MDDLQPEFLITNTAVSALHSRLDDYRDDPFDEEVGRTLREKLEESWRAARAQETRRLEWIQGGKVGTEVPSSMFAILDREEGDYSVEVWRLPFQDGDRTIFLLGVVAADTWRRDRRDGRVLKTVLSYNAAKSAILSRRWVNRDGSPIALAPPGPMPSPPAAAPLPPPLPASTPTPVKVGTDGRPAKGYRRGGASKDRDTFVLGLLRTNPQIPTMGEGGIHALVKAKFGIGMRGSHVNHLRARILREGPARDTPTELLTALDEFVQAEARRQRALDELLRLADRKQP